MCSTARSSTISRRSGPGAGGEIQLTDAIARGIERVGLAGYAFGGRRFDCGSKQGMLAATLALAAESPEYAEVLADFCASLSASGTSAAA
jgi:UTP--glucose-1-phosphate uridylyltransferase